MSTTCLEIFSRVAAVAVELSEGSMCFRKPSSKETEDLAWWEKDVVDRSKVWKEIVAVASRLLATLTRLGACSPFARSTSRRHCLRFARCVIVVFGLATARSLRDTHECVWATIYNGAQIQP